MTSEPLAELGRLLRAAREKKGWTLQQAAERTRITAKNLGSIEAGDLSKFPAAVYVRGFVRGYASALDVKEDEAMAWLDAAGFTAPSAAVAKPGVPAIEQTAVQDGGMPPAEGDLKVPWARFVPPTRTIVMGVGAFMVVVVLGVGLRSFLRWLNPPSDGPVPPSPFQQAAPAPVPAKTPAAIPRAPAARPAPPPPVARPAPTPAVAPAAPAAPALPTGVILSVTATAVCEIQYQIDEKRARWMTLKPGDFTVLKARTQLRVLVGNPAAIVMSTPQGPVPLPKTSHHAENLLLTPGGIQKLALPVPSSTLQ